MYHFLVTIVLLHSIFSETVTAGRWPMGQARPGQSSEGRVDTSTQTPAQRGDYRKPYIIDRNICPSAEDWYRSITTQFRLLSNDAIYNEDGSNAHPYFFKTTDLLELQQRYQVDQRGTIQLLDADLMIKVPSDQLPASSTNTHVEDIRELRGPIRKTNAPGSEPKAWGLSRNLFDPGNPRTHPSPERVTFDWAIFKEMNFQSSRREFNYETYKWETIQSSHGLSVIQAIEKANSLFDNQLGIMQSLNVMHIRARRDNQNRPIITYRFMFRELNNPDPYNRKSFDLSLRGNLIRKPLGLQTNGASA